MDKPAEPGRWFAFPLTTLYALIVLNTIAAHEPWRDEAQTWLMGRDATLAETFALLPYQGHPALWYLMVRVLVRLGFPYYSMGFLHGLLAVANAFLVLRFAPFPRLTRALLVFSFWMFWMYAVEARVYAVGLLLLFLIAWRYPRRHEQPLVHGLLIFLLFNSNLHMAFLAGALAAAFGVEILARKAWTRDRLAALGLMGLGAVALLWQFHWLQAPADNMYGGVFARINAAEKLPKAAACAFFPGSQPVYEVLIPPALALIALMFFSLLSRPLAAGFLAAHLAGMGLMLWLTSPLDRHYGLILLGAIFALWVGHYEPERSYLQRFRWPDYSRRSQILWCALNVSLLASLVAGWRVSYQERKYDFSGTKRMAEFILRNNLAGLPIAAHRYAHLSSIAPYFPGKSFWYIGIGKPATYVRQDIAHRRANELSNEAALDLLATQIPAGPPLLLLLDRPLEHETAGFQLIHWVADTVGGTDEKCWLYLRGPQGPAPAGAIGPR